MNQKIKVSKMAMFHTPESLEYILDWIEGHPAEERAHLYVVMGMTWNFLADLINKTGEFADGANPAE